MADTVSISQNVFFVDYCSNCPGGSDCNCIAMEKG